MFYSTHCYKYINSTYIAFLCDNELGRQVQLHHNKLWYNIYCFEKALGSLTESPMNN